MNILNFLYRNGPWITVLLFCISAAFLGFFILNVIKLVKQSHILSVPLIEQQDITFDKAGRVVLCGEGPRLTTRYANLVFELSADDGTRLKGRTTWFHARTSGISKVRMDLKSYEIPRPGRYQLRIQGLGPDRSADAKHRIVFMRPHLAKSIGYIIGIVLAALVFIGSVVFFFLSFTLRGTNT